MCPHESPSVSPRNAAGLQLHYVSKHYTYTSHFFSRHINVVYTQSSCLECPHLSPILNLNHHSAGFFLNLSISDDAHVYILILHTYADACFVCILSLFIADLYDLTTSEAVCISSFSAPRPYLQIMPVSDPSPINLRSSDLDRS